MSNRSHVTIMSRVLVPGVVGICTFLTKDAKSIPVFVSFVLS